MGAPDRFTFDASSTPPVPGGGASGYVQKVQDEIAGLWDRSCILLDTIGGTGDAITANVTPALLSSLVGGMRFILPVASSNSGAAQLNIGGTGLKSIKRITGAASAVGDLVAGMKVPLMYNSSDDSYYMLLGNTLSTGATLDYQPFTGSGTWTKPAGLDGDALVLVEGWGAGGGGGASASGGGGGGGGYSFRIFRASQLGATETVTIGPAGAVSAQGGNTTFGTLLTAYGGGGGQNASPGGGGGGGGQNAKGANGAAGLGGAGGGPAGGAAQADSSVGGGGGGDAGTGGGGDSWFGGAGGGGGQSGGNAGSGGNSVYGGGGGAGDGTGTDGSAGTSVYAGAGGAVGVAGTAPAGGGGRNALGARGECRVLVIG